MIGWVFVIEATFKEEARRWHMANHPLSVPFWVCIPMYRGSPKPQVWIVLVSFWQVSLQRGYYIGIGRHSVYVGKGEMARAVKCELQGVPRWGWQWKGLVEPACWLFLALLRFMCFIFLL